MEEKGKPKVPRQFARTGVAGYVGDVDVVDVPYKRKVRPSLVKDKRRRGEQKDKSE